MQGMQSFAPGIAARLESSITKGHRDQIMRIKVVSDESEHEGSDARAVVASMKNSSPMNRNLSVEEYMPKVREWSGETSIQTASADVFLQSLQQIGLIEILD